MLERIDEALFTRIELPDWLTTKSIDEYVKAHRALDIGFGRHESEAMPYTNIYSSKMSIAEANWTYSIFG